MSGESGPAVALITAWGRERGPGQGHVLIPLHGMVEEAAVVKVSTPRIAVVTHVFALFSRSIESNFHCTLLASKHEYIIKTVAGGRSRGGGTGTPSNLDTVFAWAYTKTCLSLHAKTTLLYLKFFC